MKAVCLIDTSVFLPLLNVPGRDENHKAVLAEFKRLERQGTFFFLPLATILETANHIGYLRDGGERRKYAAFFAKNVIQAMDRVAPWRLIEPLTEDELRDYLQDFPDYAMRGLSLSDLSIVKEYERQCALNQARRVFIWSFDRDDLKGYDCPAVL